MELLNDTKSSDTDTLGVVRLFDPFYCPGLLTGYMSRRGNRGAISDCDFTRTSHREQLRYRGRTGVDRTSVKRYDFDVLPIVFSVLAVAFVVAWALDL